MDAVPEGQEFVVDLQQILCEECRQGFDAKTPFTVTRCRGGAQPRFYHAGCREMARRPRQVRKFIKAFSTDKAEAKAVAMDIMNHVPGLWGYTKFASNHSAHIALNDDAGRIRSATIPDVVTHMANMALIETVFVVNVGQSPGIVHRTILEQGAFRTFVENVNPEHDSETVVRTWMYRPRSKAIEPALRLRNLHDIPEVSLSDVRDKADHAQWAAGICDNKPFRVHGEPRISYLGDVFNSGKDWELRINYGKFGVCQSQEQPILYKAKGYMHPASVTDQYAKDNHLEAIATSLVQER